MTQKKVAIILSGCGYLDGAEIRESVLTLLSLDTEKISYEIFAPDQNQNDHINHLTKNESKYERNILAESARIARGKISPLTELDPEQYAAIILPGGNGVAKSLCNFAFKGAQGAVIPMIGKILHQFHQKNRPIGAICIAPALIALTFGNLGVEVTIGKDIKTAQEIEKTGAKHFNKEASEFHHDQKLNILSTPAYMYDEASLSEIYEGIHGLVKKIKELI